MRNLDLFRGSFSLSSSTRAGKTCGTFLLERRPDFLAEFLFCHARLKLRLPSERGRAEGLRSKLQWSSAVFASASQSRLLPNPLPEGEGNNSLRDWYHIQTVYKPPSRAMQNAIFFVILQTNFPRPGFNTYSPDRLH